MTREELIDLGNKIINHQGTENEINALVDLFNRNVPHPEGAWLFFFPEKFINNKNDISDYEPTVEEVVDKALSYKPILL